jgi:hypothetical protein
LIVLNLNNALPSNQLNIHIMKILNKIALVAAFIFIGANISNAQTKAEKKAAKQAEIKKLIDDQNFVFKANYALPMRGGSRALTSDYDLVVTRDTIISFLPYFGRAYVAPPPGTTDGGIKVNTTKFSYVSTIKKNNSWIITIKPKDKNIADWRDVQTFNLSISPDGYGSLQVTSSNRDPISFNGYVEARRK